MPPSLVEDSVEPSLGELLDIEHASEAEADMTGRSEVASKARTMRSFIFGP